MAQATDLPTTSRFHNLSSGALADALGHADAVLKGAEAEAKALKDEIKRRGLLEAAGDSFAIRVSEQISGRLDVAAVKQPTSAGRSRLAFTALAAKIRPKDHIDILRPLLPERYPQHRLSPVIAVPAGAGRVIAREHRAQHAPRISREGILFREPPDMAGGPVFSAQRRANLDADRSRHTLAFAAAFADANANADANVSLLQT